jgi:hypothetical protein
MFHRFSFYIATLEAEIKVEVDKIWGKKMLRLDPTFYRGFDNHLVYTPILEEALL